MLSNELMEIIKCIQEIGQSEILGTVRYGSNAHLLLPLLETEPFVYMQSLFLSEKREQFVINGKRKECKFVEVNVVESSSPLVVSQPFLYSYLFIRSSLTLICGYAPLRALIHGFFFFFFVYVYGGHEFHPLET